MSHSEPCTSIREPRVSQSEPCVSNYEPAATLCYIMSDEILSRPPEAKFDKHALTLTAFVRFCRNTKVDIEKVSPVSRSIVILGTTESRDKKGIQLEEWPSIYHSVDVPVRQVEMTSWFVPRIGCASAYIRPRQQTDGIHPQQERSR